MEINTNTTAIFYYLAVFSTFLFVIKTLIFAFTGGDSEVFADFNSEFETETSFNFLSVQSILAFLMGFGWIGLAALKQWNLPLWASIASAAAFGLVLMFFSTYLMFLVKKLNQNNVKNYAACIGQNAKAYTAFKPESEGQIEVVINNKLSIEKARNNSQENIEAFSEIKIIDYKNNIFYIEKL